MQWSSGDRGDISGQRGRSGGFGVAHLGIGGFLVLLVLSWVSGTNLFSLLGTGTSAPSQSVGHQRSGAPARRPRSGSSTMVGAVDQGRAGHVGREARLALSAHEGDAVPRRDSIGVRLRAVGDRAVLLPRRSQVYLDLGFFNELSQRLGAPGDFAQAYVITHELGHHVQNLLGLNERASSDRRSGRQQRVGRAGTAGRLLRRRLGPRGVAARTRRGREGGARSGRRGRGAARRGRDRRRPAAEDVDRPRDARSLHARHVGAARRVVQAGDGLRRSARRAARRCTTTLSNVAAAFERSASSAATYVLAIVVLSASRSAIRQRRRRPAMAARTRSDAARWRRMFWPARSRVSCDLAMHAFHLLRRRPLPQARQVRENLEQIVAAAAAWPSASVYQRSPRNDPAPTGDGSACGASGSRTAAAPDPASATSRRAAAGATRRPGGTPPR